MIRRFVPALNGAALRPLVTGLLRASCLLLVAGPLWGCSSDGDNANGALLRDGASSLLLGTGSPLFVPIVDGDRVEIIHGPQGGYHIWGSLLARGLGDRLALSFTLTRLDDGLIANTVQTSARVMPMTTELLSLDGGHAGTDGGVFEFALPTGDGVWGIAPGALVFVPDPQALDGRRVRMSVVATSDEGRSVSDQRILVAHLP